MFYVGRQHGLMKSFEALVLTSSVTLDELLALSLFLLRLNLKNFMKC